MDYQAMEAAEHTARYAFASPLCVGKRVLDVACGEGYGAFVLSRAGAASVVGVDLADEAITVARRRFARDNVEFRVGDALQLPELFGPEEAFDVVVSFETIEHLANPGGFLAGIRQVLAPGGVILVSCPNDGLEAQRGISNPFHARTYTFPEFAELTTGILGPASCWYIGTIVQGIVVAEAASAMFDNGSRDMSLLTDALEPSCGYLLPAQVDHRVMPEGCTFYLGTWGAIGETVQVAAPMSRKAYLEPWWALEWFKERAACQEQHITSQDQRIVFLEEQIGEVRRASMAERAGARLALQAQHIDFQDQRIVFLEEQIGEVRRASMAERANLRTALKEAHLCLQGQSELASRLQTIESSRGYRILQWYYGCYGSNAIGFVLKRIRGMARRMVQVLKGQAPLL